MSMSPKAPESNCSNQSRSSDMVNAELALQRAVRKLRERARKAGTTVVVLKDGKIVEELP